VTDEQLVKITQEAGVTCATGDSDSESIRDQEAGPGEVRWHRRSPYWHRRDQCMEVKGSYRRLMQPVINAEDEDGKLTSEGHDSGEFFWTPLVDSDDDGFVKQPSFILGSQVGTDQFGDVVGTHPDVQPVDSKYDTVKSVAQDAW
jgi:hypothetical protein